MYCDFMGRAGDEIFNQLAKWQSMSGGLLKMPVVLRVSVGSKYGAQHSQDWSSMCAHIPGLKVVFPATPYDAKGLMYSALLGTDPVIFFESQRIYDQPELFHPGGVPVEAYEIPIGEPDVKKAGSDLTILSIGATLYRALDAAKELEEKYGISCEVIDARSIVPFNFEKVIESVKKTRKILLTSDACERGSALQTFAAKITQFAFDELDGPPVVVGARNWITPADEIEDAFFPQVVRHPRRRARAHPAAQGLHARPRMLRQRAASSQCRRRLSAGISRLTQLPAGTLLVAFCSGMLLAP